MTSDGLSQSFVGLREPFIDMNGSHLVVLCQSEMIIFRPRRGTRRHERTLCCLRGSYVNLIWPSVGLRLTSVGLIWHRADLREPSVDLRGPCVTLGASGVGLRRTFVGLRGPCLT